MAEKDFLSDEVPQEEVPPEDGERFHKDSTMFCDSCLENDQTITAKRFCVDCNDYLCSDCVNLHKKLRATRGHMLKDKFDLPVNKPVKFNALEICSEHKFEVVTHYCKSHDQVLCRLCKQIDHRNCFNVEAIDDICHDSDITEELNQTKNQLEILKSEFKENLHIAGDNKVKAETYHQNVIKGLRRIRDKDLQMISAIENTCVTVSPEITDLMKDLDIPGNNKRHKLLMMWKAKIQAKILQARLSSVRMDNTISSYRFIPTTQSDDLGVIKKCPYKIEEIAVKTSSDEYDCNMTDIKRFSDNSLIIADFKNCKIKLVDLSSNTVTKQIMLGVNPWGVTKINDQSMAITTYDEKTIFIMSTSETSPVQKTINKMAFGQCRSIVCTNDTLTVGYQGPDLIEILDLNGTVKQTIDYKKKQEMVQFGKTMYMAHNPDTNILYLSDFEMNKVHSLTCDGKLLASFTHEHLIKPKCLSLGRNNRVFVSCEGSDNVFEINSDLSIGKVILEKKDGISAPRSILYDCEQDILFVGSRNKNAIQVFML